MRILFFGWVLIIAACKQNTGVQQQSTSLDTVQFFQVAEFVASQINDVKKTPYFIYQKNEVDGKIDSSVISNNQFETLASRFKEPDINNPAIKKDYIESGFFDQTTNTYTLNYSTRNKDLEIQNIDVLLNEDASTLKRIFIRKFFTYKNDSSAIEQLSWKPDMEFKISRAVQIPGHKDKVYQSTIVWNENRGTK